MASIFYRANTVVLHLSSVLLFFFLDLKLVLPLLDTLLQLFQAQGCLLDRLDVLTTGLDRLVKPAHLQLTQGFIVVKAPIAAIEW